MSKSSRFSKVVAVPVGDVHAVASSEEYLLTLDPESSSTLIVESAERTEEPDGSVRAVVVAVQPAADGSAAEGTEAAEAADGESPATGALSVEQTTVVTPVVGGQFTVTSTTPLPKGLGTMTTELVYRGQAEGSGDTTDVDAVVTADVGVPLVGGKIARKLLENAEQSIDTALARISRQAGMSGSSE